MISVRLALAGASVLLCATRCARADTFYLRDNYVGSGFLNAFNWETMNDPSNGYVNYIDQATALQRNLTYGKL